MKTILLSLGCLLSVCCFSDGLLLTPRRVLQLLAARRCPLWQDKALHVPPSCRTDLGMVLKVGQSWHNSECTRSYSCELWPVPGSATPRIIVTLTEGCPAGLACMERHGLGNCVKMPALVGRVVLQPEQVRVKEVFEVRVELVDPVTGRHPIDLELDSGFSTKYRMFCNASVVNRPKEVIDCQYITRVDWVGLTAHFKALCLNKPGRHQLRMHCFNSPIKLYDLVFFSEHPIVVTGPSGRPPPPRLGGRNTEPETARRIQTGGEHIRNRGQPRAGEEKQCKKKKEAEERARGKQIHGGGGGSKFIPPHEEVINSKVIYSDEESGNTVRFEQVKTESGENGNRKGKIESGNKKGKRESGNKKRKGTSGNEKEEGGSGHKEGKDGVETVYETGDAYPVHETERGKKMRGGKTEMTLDEIREMKKNYKAESRIHQ